MSGYKLVSGDCEKLSCDIKYCIDCANSSTCHACDTLYELKDNACVRKTYGCNMNFCQSCGESAEICTYCMPGYQL